jgi:Tfp pilus assembly protein PilN
MVTIIPKPPKKVPQWQTMLFYFSLGFLLAALIVYFILNYFQDRSLATLDDLEERISRVGTTEDKKIENEVFFSQKRIKDFSTLFTAHQKSSQFFEFLEKKTHPEVWFTNLDLDANLPRAKLEGLARNFQTLAQQIYIFQEEDLIEEIKLTDITLGEEGEAEFSLELSLSPDIFQ